MFRIAFSAVAACVLINVPYFWSPTAKLEKLRLETVWVDSVYNKLSEDQRLGQLFMVGAYPPKGAEHEQELLNLIKNYGLGGLVFFKGDPARTASLINQYQLQSPVQMLMSMDAEWGIGMRVDSVADFPRELCLGAIRDNRLIYEMGAEVARQCKRLGITVDFAPVVDVNNNSANPVINDRSFGEDRQNVTAKGFQYMMGLQDNGVMACAKHFPGHGDTDVDSHFDLPVISRDRQRLDTVELYPFRILANHGLQSAMIAHLSVPALDTTRNLPSCLSGPIVTGVLKKQLGFQGLIFTDAMTMQGLAKYFKPGESEVLALKAGIDILLMPRDVPTAFVEIKAAIARGELTWDDLGRRVKKVLRAKYRLGLTEYKKIKVENLFEELQTPESLQLREKLLANALTLVNNNGDMVPFRRPDTLDVATVSLGATTKTPFQKIVDEYCATTSYQLPADFTEAASTEMLAKLKGRELVIVGVHDMSSKADRNYGITDAERVFLEKLKAQNKVALVVFGNPYSLRYLNQGDAILVAYQGDPTAQILAAQAIFGSLPIQGRLPVTASPEFVFGEGLMTPAFRMPYSEAVTVGMSDSVLNRIDTIANGLIAAKAAPGCQVLVARHGKVVFHRAYGYHTYENTEPVRLSDMYDLASVTKIAATTLAVMKLYDQGKLDLDKTLGDYLPELKGTNKESLIIKEVLVHQAGLQAWIPFYQETLDKSKKPKSELYQYVCNDKYCVKVADKLFLDKSYVDSVWTRVVNSELRNNKEYVYSDLGLILTARVVERITGKTLDKYVAETFYEPMGLLRTMYNPLSRFAPICMVPTENDTYFRYQVLCGCVHDMAAAMFGGVSGHAGLFSSAVELASLQQMLLDGGEWNGIAYLKKSTIDKFTAYHNTKTSRRGIGFDKPDVDGGGNVAKACSAATFGHTGFTGTCVWTDPEKDLVYVFLSNRTFPSMDNRKLITGNYRTRIQEVVYNAVKF